MVGASEVILGVEIAVVVGGFGYAAASDLRTREVSDRVWQLMGVLGAGLGAVALAPGGLLPVVAWIVVAAFTLQHVVAWDAALGPRGEASADLLEAGLYAAVIVGLAVAVVHWGVSATGVPWAVLAVLVSVLFARGLFEAGVLYGGADAKALMIAALVLPTFASVLLPLSGSFALVLAFLPFAVNLLMNAALLSLAIPIAIAARNLARREFRFPSGFTGYMLPVAEIPHRFVWLKDPLSVGATPRDELETAEDDQRERERLAAELSQRGVRRVWVTPQIPFVVLMAAGAIAALLAGNLVLDLIALA